MSEYRVYLDGTLLANNPIGLNNLEVQIIREDGFQNSEQILREKSETELTFIGDGYRYFCAQKKDSICNQILVSIEYKCNEDWYIIFEGITYIKMVEFNLFRGEAKTQIKDNSFTGLIKDFTDTEIQLYFTRTRNCLSLGQVDKGILMINDPGNLSDTSTRKAFDVFDVLQYYIWYITDNRIDIESDYLTGVSNNQIRYAITTGWNLYNNSGSVDQQYPKLTFNTVFNEIRKKTRVYMGVEYRSDGTPYIRIEPESYFYDDTTELLNIPIPPANAVEKVDINRLFNSIKVGSSNTDIENSPEYPQDSLTAWNDETFNSCGYCSVDRNAENSELDLVNDFIIDTNLIYETLNGVSNTHDSDIFMFEWYVNPGNNIPVGSVTLVDGVYIYNEQFINEAVIENWVGYSPNCISLSGTTPNYFLAIREYDTISTGTFTDAQFDFLLRHTNEVIDGNNAFQCITYPPITGSFGSIFTVPTNGAYSFKIEQNVHITSFDCLSPTDQSGYRLGVWVYDNLNNLIATLIPNYVYYQNDEDDIHLEYESPPINLLANYYVRPFIDVEQSANCGSPGATFRLDNGRFELLGDSTTCETATESTDAKANVLEFTSQICYTDFKTLTENKRGYISVSGKEFYIKNIKWSEKNTTFQLIGSDTLCGCDEVPVCNTDGCAGVSISDVYYDNCGVHVWLNVESQQECDSVQKIEVLLERSITVDIWEEVPITNNQFDVHEGTQQIIIDIFLAIIGDTSFRVSIKSYCPLTFWSEFTSPELVAIGDSGGCGI